MRIQMTLAQARALNIVFCTSCGYPPNNHFGNGKRGGKCAHDSKCKGFKQMIVLPEVKEDID
jgi:hypothetical protein